MDSGIKSVVIESCGSSEVTDADDVVCDSSSAIGLV